MVPNSCMMGRHDTDCYGYLVDTIKLMHAYNQQQFKKTTMECITVWTYLSKSHGTLFPLLQSARMPLCQRDRQSQLVDLQHHSLKDIGFQI